MGLVRVIPSGRRRCALLRAVAASAAQRSCPVHGGARAVPPACWPGWLQVNWDHLEPALDRWAPYSTSSTVAHHWRGWWEVQEGEGGAAARRAVWLTDWLTGWLAPIVIAWVQF